MAPADKWILNFGARMSEGEVALYESHSGG